MAYSLSRSRKKFIEWKSEAAPPKDLLVDLNSGDLANYQFTLERGWEELWDEQNDAPYFWSLFLLPRLQMSILRITATGKLVLL